MIRFALNVAAFLFLASVALAVGALAITMLTT